MTERVTEPDFTIPSVLRGARLHEEGAVIPDPNYAGTFTVVDSGQEHRVALDIHTNPDRTLRVPHATCTCHEGLTAWGHATCPHVAAALLPVLEQWDKVRGQLTRSHLWLVTGVEPPTEPIPTIPPAGASKYTRTRDYTPSEDDKS